MMLSSITRSGVVLGLFAVATVAFIAVTEATTAGTRAENARQAALKNLYEILPPETHDNNLLADTVMLPAGGLPGNEHERPARIALRDGNVVGVVLPATAPDGYNGRIRLLVGVRPDGTLLGVRVTGHRETPGLGDKVETRKSDWITRFTGLSLQQPAPLRWKVRKDGGEFDQFTGATITPRAVVSAVYRTLRHFEAHGEEILAQFEKERAS